MVYRFFIKPVGSIYYNARRSICKKTGGSQSRLFRELVLGMCYLASSSTFSGLRVTLT